MLRTSRRAIGSSLPRFFALVSSCILGWTSQALVPRSQGRSTQASSLVLDPKKEREEWREERAGNTGLGCVLGRWGITKVWTSELQKIQNEVLRRPKALPEASWTPEGPIGTLWGRSLGAPGSPLGAPGPLWGEVVGALGVPGDACWMLFWVRGRATAKHRKP